MTQMSCSSGRKAPIALMTTAATAPPATWARMDHRDRKATRTSSPLPIADASSCTLAAVNE